MGAKLDRTEIRALNVLTADAQLAALKIKGFQWVDLADDDSIGSALVAVNIKPSSVIPQWDQFKEAVRVLRDGRH